MGSGTNAENGAWPTAGTRAAQKSAEGPGRRPEGPEGLARRPTAAIVDTFGVASRAGPAGADAETAASPALETLTVTNGTYRLEARSIKPLSDHFEAWRDQLGVEVFVETGTHMGATARAAAEVFDEVHTIELSQELYARARELFAAVPNLHCHQGDSISVLPELVPQLAGRRALYWLDAHFSGQSSVPGVMTARGEANCPTLDEIAVLRQAGVDDAVILVDDIRQFFDPASTDPRDAIHTGYADLNRVVDAIDALGSFRCHVVGDVLLAHPSACSVTPAPAVRAMTASRLFSGNIESFVDVLNHERTFRKLSEEEKPLFGDLVQQFARESASGQIQFGAHYLLWYALMQAGDGRHDDALKALELAERFGIDRDRAEAHRREIVTARAMSEFA